MNNVNLCAGHGIMPGVYLVEEGQTLLQTPQAAHTGLQHAACTSVFLQRERKEEQESLFVIAHVFQGCGFAVPVPQIFTNVISFV